MWFLTVFLSLPLTAAVTDLSVIGATSTQIIVSYSAPTNAVCTLEASTSNTYAPLALDVDTAYYPGSNSDDRAGNVALGRHRIVVLGKQGPSAIETSQDGYSRSRALQADTLYYIRVTCGVDQGAMTARTANLLLGSTRGEPLATGNATWSYSGVAGNPIALPEYPDPYTGTLIKQPAALRGFGYSMSTATGGSDGYQPGSECNITLTGVKGSCKFTSASGTGWTASDGGTITNAVRADDNVYVQYNGTTQDKLFVRLGGGFGAEKIPTHSTYGGTLSFQNLIFRALTSSTSNDGAYLRVCFTADEKNCASPDRRITLTTAEATYRVCNDSPCTVAEQPGDFMLHGSGGGITPGAARIYNTGAGDTTIRFTGSRAAEACNTLYVNEILLTYRSPTNGINADGLVIGSKNCGATPPQIVVNNTVDLSHNGTTGVTFWMFSGAHRYNPRFGILLWKESTTQTSNIQVDLALYRAATSPEYALNLGSGGFGKRCQTVPTTGGYYLCLGGSQTYPSTAMIFGIKPSASGVDIVNYGQAQWRGDQYNANLSNLTYSTCSSVSTNDAMWDDEVPGVLYCYMPSTYPNPRLGGAVDGRNVLVKITLSLNIPAASDPDGGYPGTRSRVAGVSNMTILTPCLSPCAATSDDYTPPEQRRRYSASYDSYQSSKFASCSLEAVQGLTIIEVCRAGSQDTHSWIFAYDLGNRLAVGNGFTGTQNGNTQHIFGGFNVASSPLCRWCGVHTYQNPMKIGGSPFALIEPSAKCPLSVTGNTAMSSCNAFSSGTCGACPAVTVDGYNYSGKSYCGTLDITSAWNGGWGSQPGGFATADPVTSGCNESPNLHWIQSLQVGDFITAGGEIAKIIQKPSATQLVLHRGIGQLADNSSWGPVAHSSGIQWYTYAFGGNPSVTTIDPEEGPALAWYFSQDPGGSNAAYTFSNRFQNHGFHAQDFGLTPKWLLGFFDFNSPSANAASFNTGSFVQYPVNFAGKDTNCHGNACETHPNATQIAGDALARSWWSDVHPRLISPSGTNGVGLAPGKTYIYQVNSTTANIDPKQYDLEVYMGAFPFRRVDTLTDDPANTGQWCIAILAGDCFSGSTAGKAYFVNEVFDTTFIALNTCRESQFGTTNGDFCIGNSNGIGAAVTQWRLPPGNGYSYTNGKSQRAISKANRSYREAATENVKADPTGTALFTRSLWYILPTPMVGFDSKNRATFSPVPVSIPGVPAGTSTAVVEFGYNDSFQCSRNRSESCLAESASLNEAIPFRFSHETVSGIACGSGCNIVVPAVHNRVLYYRVKLRNVGGNTIYTGPTQLLATQ